MPNCGPEEERIHRLDQLVVGEVRNGRSSEGVGRRRAAGLGNPHGEPEQDSAVGLAVREVTEVPELVDHDGERGVRIGRIELRTIQEREAFGDRAGGRVAELGPGESEHARVGAEQELEDLAAVVIDDGGKTVGRGGVEEGQEVGFVDVDRQVGTLDVADRRGRDALPLTEGISDERVGLGLGQVAEVALVGDSTRCSGRHSARGTARRRRSLRADRRRARGR